MPTDAWYYNAVMWAAANGLIEGHNGRFDPNRAITRQEMAVMLGNYASFKGYAMPVNRAMPNFADHRQIDIWAETAVIALSEAGVINGSNNRFNPQMSATRAEVATMFRNFMRLVLPDNESR